MVIQVVVISSALDSDASAMGYKFETGIQVYEGCMHRLCQCRDEIYPLLLGFIIVNPIFRVLLLPVACILYQRHIVSCLGWWVFQLPINADYGSILGYSA